VRTLIDRGADVRACDLQMQTPLHEVLDRLDLDAHATTAIVQVLVAAGADIHATDSQGRAPLGMARDSGKSALVEALNPQTVAAGLQGC
jgi:ankyrin repeat protein